MKIKALFILLLSLVNYYFVLSQSQVTPQRLGFRELRMMYNGDTVKVLVQSKKGEENMPKPLFLFCEGSLPQPTIKHDGDIIYDVFPFNFNQYITKFHLVIINKPFIPVVGEKSKLGHNFTYLNDLGKIPYEYVIRNHLDYYAERNIEILKLLLKKSWVFPETLIVAGHSQGSIVASKMASDFDKITHLIYSGGNPLGRILRSISGTRKREKDSVSLSEFWFENWEIAVEDSNNTVPNGKWVVSFNTFHDFSLPQMPYLMPLNIPILVTYGTKDESCPFNDYLRIETIRQKKDNFTFIEYTGTEHNYYPVDSLGNVNYQIRNWDKVGEDWLEWILDN